MRANALVVESETTWLLIEDVPDGEEGVESYLSLADFSDEEATRKANAELARVRDGQTQITLGIDPTGDGDVPFDDWGIGDLADVDDAERRCLGLTFTRDRDHMGRIAFVPKFGDIIDSPTLLQQKLSRRFNAGGLGGVARTAARPVPPAPIRPDQNVRIPIVSITQADYDALDPPMPGVMYAILD